MADTDIAPLIKWAGGKRRLLTDIRQVTPDTFGRYFEPFFGSGALFFSILPEDAQLSDANSELIEMYTEVRDNVDGVIEALRRLHNSEEDYYKVRSSSPRTPATKAARFIYLCTLSFNGIYRQNLKGEFNVPYGYKTHLKHYDTEHLRKISGHLNHMIKSWSLIDVNIDRSGHSRRITETGVHVAARQGRRSALKRRAPQP
jgi:DNA adenine methylase